jgi:hypothetical protein
MTIKMASTAFKMCINMLGINKIQGAVYILYTFEAICGENVQHKSQIECLKDDFMGLDQGRIILQQNKHITCCKYNG